MVVFLVGTVVLAVLLLRAGRRRKERRTYGLLETAFARPTDGPRFAVYPRPMRRKGKGR